MSVDKAFREMIRSEVETQLRPVREAIARLQQQTEGVPALEELAAQLAPLASLFGLSVEVPRTRPARPAAPRRGRPAAKVNGARACAIVGCGRPSRTKGYCSAHYQKLRMLERTGRRPQAWVDFAPPDSVADVVLPRGRAAAKALAQRKRRG